MNHKRMMSAVFLALLSGSPLYGQNMKTVYWEDFDRYGFDKGLFSPEQSIWESPPSYKSLYFSPQKMSKIRTGNFVIAEQNRSENSELSFNFSFPNNSKKQLKLLFTMQSKKTGEKKEYSIVIRDEGSIISGSLDTSVLAPVCVNSNLMQLPPFVFNRMHSALLRINGSHIDFYVERDGKMVREISAEHSGDYLSEFNFETDSTVIMDGIRVRAELEKKTVVSSGNQKTPETNVNTVGFKQTAKIPEYANTSNTEVSIPLDVDNIQQVTFDVRLQRYPGSFTLDFDKQDNTKNKHSFIFSSIAQSANKTVLGSSQEMKNGTSVPVKKNITEKVLLPDAGYNVTSVCGNYRVYTRPLLQWKIEEPETTRIISNWDHDYPAGSQTVMSVSLKKADSANDGQNGFEVYLNGSYIGFVPQNFPQNVTAGLPAGAEIEVKTISAADKVKNSRFLPLNFENNVAIANPNESKWNISLDGSLVSVPFYVQNKPADLGKCEEHLGSFALECDGFLQTTPFDGLPGRYMLQIPQRPFYKAHVLCAVCDDDAEKVPVLTLHLSEVSGQGRSQAMCQNRIVVDEKDQNIRKIGKVQKDGQSCSLYLVESQFDIGSIQDLITNKKLGKLNFEILGELYDKDNYYCEKSMKPSEEVKSNIRVFGVTLEEAPVYFQTVQGRVTNVYYPNESPEMTVNWTNPVKGKYLFQAVVKDSCGNEIQRESWQSDSEKAGGTKTIKFTSKDYGWYSVRYDVFDAQTKRQIMGQDSAYAILAPDTRKAGFKSPFFTWNFRGAHGTPADTEVWGDILKRMGVYRCNGFRANESEKTFEKWGFTFGEFNTPQISGKTPAEREADAKKKIEDLTSRFPHCKIAMIFHESGGGPFPMEFLYKEMGEDPNGKKMVDTALELAGYWRKFAPDVKIQIGNSGYSMGCIGRLFRHNFPSELIDYMGEESVGMTIPPERSTAAANWELQKLADIFGYSKVRPNACYEWKSRVVRHLGKIKQADFRVRDAIIALIWKQELVPVIGISEMANSYYNTIWGDGAFTRYPILNPEPSYVGTAVLTQVLDCAEFVRLIPTGSNTVYAAEFKRGDKFIYAMWTARGEQNIRMKFSKAGHAKMIEMLGKEKDISIGGSLPEVTLQLSESPCYLEINEIPANVQIVGEREFQRAAEYPHLMPNTTIPLNAEIVSFADKKDSRLEFLSEPNPPYLSIRKAGKYSQATVNDEIHGKCLELRLIPSNEKQNELTMEYGVFKLKEPVELKGEPDTLFMTVKGNSSWGKVYWELEDADGEKWFSAGTVGYGCEVYDWPDAAGINFDGWHRLCFPLSKKSPVKINAPGDNEWQWQHTGNGDNQITYPVKVTGFAVSMPCKTLMLKDMIDIDPVIRILDIGSL